MSEKRSDSVTVTQTVTPTSTDENGNINIIFLTIFCICQVLGCHAKYTKGGNESYPHNYPLDNGTTCNCYNYYGAICVASCASNIRNHEVRLQYGKGATRVACSAGNVVLGCGIQPKDAKSSPILAIFGKKYEKWRTWAVRSIDSCECYDSFGATCYAICGQLN